MLGHKIALMCVEKRDSHRSHNDLALKKQKPFQPSRAGRDGRMILTWTGMKEQVPVQVVTTS
jgi:hypothetical protein